MKTEHKYQWSSKLENGEIMVVRADTREELVLDREWAKSLVSPLNTEKPQITHPERAETASEELSLFDEEKKEEPKTLDEKYQGKTQEEIPETDESFCDLHEVQMKERTGKNGIFYSHSQGEYPKLDWCSGQGWASERKK